MCKVILGQYSAEGSRGGCLEYQEKPDFKIMSIPTNEGDDYILLKMFNWPGRWNSK